ncbi:putative ribonuclease H-like domain-containing protein [Rosa chinensis]|uniref:Putative ribonuclease H-like domain-containing protein n=1 Tax=Rosa chinensis TaxID=74649 RepID=A0A2P6RF95_ROSCH|nr:putative ribonuclease H-like domain-containing protein [Rosa chinensis]
MPVCLDKVIWSYAEEWTSANFKLNTDTVHRYTVLTWKKPIANFYKLNIDGTRSSSTGKIGAGGVIRDHFGNWITGFQVNLGIGEIPDVEAWGLLYGLKLALSLHISHLEIESDSAILVQLMQKAVFSLHPLGSLLKGCSNIMDAMGNAQLSHIFKECNMTADSLAKNSINHELGLIIFEYPPVHAAQPYLDDISAVSRARRCSCSNS